MTVERLTVRFGFDSAGGGGGFGGHPDVNSDRGGALIPVDAASWANAPLVRPVAGLPFEALAQVRKMPARVAGDGPITAISIAPDSALDCVDMCIATPGEISRHRIAVGAPFLGTIDEHTDVYFAYPGSLPPIGRPNSVDVGGLQSARFDLTTVWWDCISQADVNAGLSALLYPLRLNVYRGVSSLGGISKRGPYEANANYEIVNVDGAGTSSQPAIIVLTPGRRRVRVDAGIYRAADGASAASLTVHGAIGRKTLGDNGSDNLDDRQFDPLLVGQALPVGAGDDDTGVVFDYAGNPYFAIVATITGGHIGTRGWLNVQAWDGE